MTDTKTITHSDLITRLTAEGFEADWDCLGGDWWGVCVVDDVSLVIITGGDGGNGAKRDDLLTHCGVGFYHESDWVADMPEAPTDWDEFVSLIRAWFTEGSIDGKSYKEAG
jgi:hypothetical protein